MKLKNCMLSLCLCAAIAVNPIVVFAAPIDNVEIYDPAGESDEIVFVAGEHQSSQTGEGEANTQTEEEQNIASQNASVFREQQKIRNSLVSSTVNATTSVYIPGTSVLVREDIPITVQELMKYIAGGLKFDTIPGLYGIYHSRPEAEVSENTQKAVEALKKTVLGSNVPTGSLPFQIGSDLLTEDWLMGIDTTGWKIGRAHV